MKDPFPIPADLCRRLLCTMKRIRMVENAIAKTYSKWQMRCPTHLCIGQESVPAAMGAVLRKDDFVVSTHRSHGHYLAKGGNLKKMIAELYGKQTGCSRGRGGSMHLVDLDSGFKGSTAIVGGTIPIGVGLGLSISLAKTDQISCVFLGDGSTETGVFCESLNFAALKHLPVLFICENNLYSVYTPLKERQPKTREIYKVAHALGVCSEKAHPNDMVDAYERIQKAVRNIRMGNGPWFIEFPTYRWLEHCGPNTDNDLGYRSRAEVDKWVQDDALAKFEHQLLSEGILDKGHIDAMTTTLSQEIKSAFDYATASPFPDSRDLKHFLFKEDPAP